MRMTMIAAAIAVFGFGGGMAEAMPIAPIDHAPAAKAEPVDYACGRGFHLNQWGNCRRNWDRPPPPRYGWRNDRRDRWDRRPPPRYGWREERAYGWSHRPPPRWDRGYYGYGGGYGWR